jgi:EAL domain-containing protein (putative c-di-GMP-specific phosphodiesterase class I)
LSVEISTVPEFSFAYQPIVDIESRTVFAFEALVRGRANQPAGVIFGAIDPRDLHRFDRAARLRAIELAASLGLETSLSLNLLPRSLDSEPDAIDSTIEAARCARIPATNIIIEVTEGEMIHDAAGFAERMNTYRAQGIRFAIDDFGAGFSGLNLLAEFQPDEVKLDMHLVRDIESKGPRQAIVRAVIQACDDLGIDVIAEGIESEAEYRWFKRAGVRLFQGYLFCRPAFEALPAPIFPQ